MKICFIADSSSIHVQRIVSYYIHQKDDILILSTAMQISEIPGAKTIYLLKGKKTAPSAQPQGNWKARDFMDYPKVFFPRFVKAFANRSMRTLHLLRKRSRCLEEIRRFDPDAIYCFRSFPEGMLASYCHVRPLLLRTAGPDISKLPKYPVYRQIIRKGLRTADVLVTESLWERRLLQELCDNDVDPEVNIIGVDLDLFQVSASKEKLRGKYNLPHDAFIVISNRYLEGHYNGWLIVKAIESLMEQSTDLMLVYLSPSQMGPHTISRTKAITRRFPRIKFINGPIPHAEVPDFLGCGDIYVSFASFDGIPNSLLEAMACGLVPIVGDLPQLHEWVEHGVTGYLVPQADIKGLAAKIGELYRNREVLSDMSVRCIRRVHENGSYEECSKRTRNTLKRLVEEAGKARD